MEKFLLSSVICFALVFQGVSNPSIAEAASCSGIGGQSGRLKHSGQLNGISAKVCGNEIWKLVGKPSKPSKPVKPLKPFKPKSPVKWNKEFSVVPDRPKISYLGSKTILVNQEISLNSLAVKHTRNRMLLWYPTQVRFKPEKSAWFIDGTHVAAATQVLYRWGETGSHLVRLRVSYSVKYRIVGRSSWLVLPGLVNSESAPLLLAVDTLPANKSEFVSLVHWNCFQKSTALGC